jgi:GDP-4-dehydro-6-deoxy-D-mannose reductase
MRCLVTGAAGFIGSHLVEFLAASGHEVTGLGRLRTTALDEAGGGFAFIGADLCDRRSVGAVLDATRPEIVFHLATIGLFDALLERTLAPRIVMPGSSSEYAPSRDGQPIGEDAPLLPSSPYAVSKLAQDEMGRLYHAYHGLDIVRCRPFFLIGPRKEGDAASDFARGVVAIEQGQASSLPVGNLDVVRDLLDVRDGVEALWTLARHGQPGAVYNICSGTGYSLREVMSIYRGLARAEVRERVDPARIRPIEEMVKVGDPARLVALGWSPRRPVHRTLEDILNYWRDRETRRATDDRRRTEP